MPRRTPSCSLSDINPLPSYRFSRGWSARFSAIQHRSLRPWTERCTRTEELVVTGWSAADRKEVVESEVACGHRTDSGVMRQPINCDYTQSVCWSQPANNDANKHLRGNYTYAYKGTRCDVQGGNHRSGVTARFATSINNWWPCKGSRVNGHCPTYRIHRLIRQVISASRWSTKWPILIVTSKAKGNFVRM